MRKKKPEIQWSKKLTNNKNYWIKSRQNSKSLKYFQIYKTKILMKSVFKNQGI